MTYVTFTISGEKATRLFETRKSCRENPEMLTDLPLISLHVASSVEDKTKWLRDGHGISLLRTFLQNEG